MDYRFVSCFVAFVSQYVFQVMECMSVYLSMHVGLPEGVIYFFLSTMGDTVLLYYDLPQLDEGRT